MALDVSRLKAMTEGYSSLGHRTDNSVLEVSLEKIERDESQPRKKFDEETLQALAESIREYGLIQPIVVRKKPNTLDQYIIVAGERRYRASQLAGASTIKAVLLSVEPERSELGYIQVIENIKRDALTTAELAEFISGRLAAREKAVAIGKKLGISKPQMSRYAAWDNMPECIRELVRQEKIPSIKIAYELFRKWKEMPESVEETLRTAADDFEWTISAVNAIGLPVDQELPSDAEEMEDQQAEPMIEEQVDTVDQWEAAVEDEPEYSERNGFSVEESAASVSSNDVEEPLDRRVDGSRRPCVVVGIEGREAVLMLKAVADGFVSVKFFDEPSPIEVEVDRVRLLRVDDGQGD